MRGARFLLVFAVALAAAGCARQQQAYYVIDPATGRPVPMVSQQPYAQPQYAQQGYERQTNGQQSYAQADYRQPAAQPSHAPSARGLFSSSPAYAQQTYAQPEYQQPVYQPPAAKPQAAPSTGRGLFTSRGLFNRHPNAPVYAQQPAYAPQYSAPQYAAPQPQYATGSSQAAAASAYAYAAPGVYEPPYTLDSGDKLRIVVFGQDGITNSYMVGVDGNVNLPLVGSVPARGVTTQQLSQIISERLKQGYVREPHVSVQIDTYRPFFILGEVTTPGQYPYVANMTAETAVAIAGGFTPRAYKKRAILTRNVPNQQFRGNVPLDYPIRPGDTIVIKERWF
jgi:polysaccharide export outer membrane protein